MVMMSALLKTTTMKIHYKMGLKNVSAFEMSKKMAITGFVRHVQERLK